MMNEIINRRSIRKYKDLDVSRKDIAEVLQAGILAPFSKNRQPWKFIVVSGKAKEEMLEAMNSGNRGDRFHDQTGLRIFSERKH